MFEFISIGQILKPFRTEGDLLARINPLVFEDISSCQAIFIKIDGLEVPFFIQEIELDEESCIIKLEDFNSPEDVKPFNGHELLMRKSDITDPDSIRSPLDLIDLAGFKIVDINSNRTFIIVNTEQYPQQLMALVKISENDLLIPLVENLMVDIDLKNKSIVMDLPEGLI